MTTIILFIFPIFSILYAEQDTSQPRTVDQCYGQPIPVACGPGHMVKVNNAFYRQTENCRGGYQSNYCSKEEPSNPACVGNQTCIFTTPWIYLSSDCGYSNNFLVSYQCVPANIQHDICEEQEIRATSGYMVSPSYPNKYPKSLQCHSRVSVRAGQRIRVYLLDLYLAYYNYDVDKQCVDALWIMDGKERTDYLCSGRQRGLVFTSSSSHITVYFSSEGHDYLNAKGFWLFFEGVDAHKIKPQKEVSYVKKPSQRSHATKAEDKLLSLLPIQVTPTDSSIVPPAPAKSQEVETEDVMLAREIITVPSVKVPDARQSPPDGNHASTGGHENYHQYHKPSERKSREQILNQHKSTHRKDDILNLNWENSNQDNAEGVHWISKDGKHSQGGATIKTEISDDRKPNPYDYKNAKMTKEIDYKKPRYSSRRYPNARSHRPPAGEKSEEQLVRDKSKETLASLNLVRSTTMASVDTSKLGRHKSTRVTYIPTETTGNIKLNEDEEMLSLLEDENMVVNSPSRAHSTPVRSREQPVIQENVMIRQTPMVVTDTAEDEKDKTTPRNLIHQTETPVITVQTETPAGNSPHDSALPWNSVVASQVKENEKHEESATGGIVGGAAGCILVVLAFVVLAIFWRRRHPNDNSSIPSISSKRSYNDIIMAYGPNGEEAPAGMTNYAFEHGSPPAPLKEFPLETSVPNPNYVGPGQSWHNLLPIDEIPELIYAQQKGKPGEHAPPKPSRSMLWMKSKSLDDLCSKIGSKVVRRRRKPPIMALSQSMDCLKRDYENVILPPSYNKLVRNAVSTDGFPAGQSLQRGGSLDDLLEGGDVFPPALSPSTYDMHLMAMQHHMQQQQLHQQQYLQQQQAAFQQHQAALEQQQNFFPMGRVNYESLHLDPSAATSAHAAAVSHQDPKILTRYETMTLHKRPAAADEVAL